MNTNSRLTTINWITKPLLAVMSLGLFGSSAFAVSTPGSVKFNVTLSDYTGKSGSSHWTVAWVTTGSGTFGKTVRLQGTKYSVTSSQWNSHCPQWWAAKQNTANGGNNIVADGYTSATASNYSAGANNPISPVWDCRDANNNLVPDGDYKFWIQYAEDSGAGPVLTTGLLWTKGATSFSQSYPAQGSTGSPVNTNSFTSMSIIWTPTAPAAPEIAVEQPAGTDLTNGSATTDFGTVTLGASPSLLTFTVKNTGTANLTGLSISKDGSHKDDFTVGSLATSVAAGGSTTFTVSFSPGAEGARTAAIHIASNDSDENPFDINLTGSGITSFGAWASSAGLGTDANPAASPQYDGVTNLEKFAFNLDPSKPDVRKLTVGAEDSAGLPGTTTLAGPVLQIEFIRRKATTTPGITYTAQVGSDLSGWTNVTGTAVSIDSTWERVTVTDSPPPGSTRRFGRVLVSQP
ncbi:MAG: DUF2271 domain-containing protein [Akkermansiaceae bacterium]|nr:DUF2271 domain-containing protein [Akkermansiaceae bacterium]